MYSQEELAFRLAWGLPGGPMRGPRPQFTIEEVAQAGVKVADELGLEGLSLARVAQELELTTTALYRYVPAKNVLIELIADAAAGRVPVLVGDTWQDRATFWTQARATQIRRHPWLVNVQPTGLPRLPRTVAWIESLLVAVADQPLDGLRLALLLDTVATTYTRNALAGAEEATPPAWLLEVIGVNAPYLAQATRKQQHDDELSAAIAIVLQGVASESVAGQ